MKKKIYLLFILFLFPFNVYSYSSKIIPGGNTIGISINTKGVMVVGFYKIDGKYNKGNPELKEGDYITKINDININTVDDLINAVNTYGKDKLISLSYIRNNKEKETNLSIIETEDTYKTGLYVKDSVTGIGTLSYIDPESNVYGALGHEVQESSSKKHVDIESGKIFRNSIIGIERSKDGSPGSKNAKFYNSTIYGDVIKNTKYGIYGMYSSKYDIDDAVEVKGLSDIKLGKAYIRTVTKGEEVKDYEIEITKINKDSKLKSIAFKITDKELLEKTGGVVQGMSGSPIMQDGYLIGAVTHVLIDDVKSGYGVSIITMLNEGDKLVN
ncbi:MAG: PDZ domain-containing protein [Bacilli bacterium]|nr:PDZ domain-containing protein [Bacilli bacterium]